MTGSLELRLSNGLDKCAGQLEVKYYGSWWSMISTDWSKQNSDMVCQHLQCGKSKESNHYKFVKSKLLPLKWKLECNSSSILNCSMAKVEIIHQTSVVSILCDSMGFSIFVLVYICYVAHGSTVGSAVASNL